MKIAIGFKGERSADLPQQFIDLMKDNPLTGDLFVTSIGYISSATHNNKIEYSKEEEYVLIYCTSGSGKITQNEIETPISANRSIILSTRTDIIISPNHLNPWSIYWIAFQGSKAKIYASMMDQVTFVPSEIHSRIEDKINLFELIFEHASNEISIKHLNYANIILAQLLLSFIYNDIFKENNKLDNNQTDNIVNIITKYMSENITHNLTLDQLAGYAGYSKSQLHRKFTHEMDCSPIDYFNKMKINKASIYLIKSNLSITQISEILGYSNTEYFSRIFKKSVGITASQFRKENFRL